MAIALFVNNYSLSANTVTSDRITPISYQVCFTPQKPSDSHHCDQLLINTIASARNNVLVQAYSFTSAPIAQRLVQVAKNGVNVGLVIDKSQVNARYSKVQPLYVNYPR